MPSAINATPSIATPSKRTSIGIAKFCAKYLSRNPTPKNKTTTPIRVSALPPVNHAHSGFGAAGVRGGGGTLRAPIAGAPNSGACAGPSLPSIQPSGKCGAAAGGVPGASIRGGGGARGGLLAPVLSGGG